MRRHYIRRCNVGRREMEGYKRLLKAIFEPSNIRQPAPIESLPDPPLHPYSIIWSLVDEDPRRWN